MNPIAAPFSAPDLAHAVGRHPEPNGHGLELISISCPGLARSSRSSSSLKNPALKGTADAGTIEHHRGQASLPETITVPWWGGQTLRYQYN